MARWCRSPFFFFFPQERALARAREARDAAESAAKAKSQFPRGHEP